VTRDDRLRIAVFIDFDNIEIGVKNTLGASFDAGLVLEALKERGDVVSKIAYSDWQRAGGYSRSLTQHAIKMVQRNLTPGGDKNGADINLALDALEMAFTHPHINAFVIVGGDSDFISLVEKLKQYDKKIFVVGGRQFTSIIMQKNCHEFIAYENLVGATGGSSSSGGRRQSEPGRVRVERVPIDQAIPLVTRGLKVLSDREVSPQLGLLKSTLLQLDSTFSERSYGAGSFRDFVEKLEKLGLVKLQQVKGSLLVTAAEGASAAMEAAAEASGTLSDESDNGGEAVDRPLAVSSGESESADDNGARPRGESPAPSVIGSMADGVKEFRRILTSGEVRRWPMYLRNVKQLIRQVSPEFDERAYGFANPVDLLRAAARENIVRVDRDRQGVIRVFQGNVAVEAPQYQPPVKKIFDIEDELAEEAARAAQAAQAQGTPPAAADDDDDEDDAQPSSVEPADEPAAAEPAAASMPRIELDEDEDEPNFNKPGAGGEDRVPSAARPAPSRKRPAPRRRAPVVKAGVTTRERTPRPRKSVKR
jgi:uncharacterized LabA/DUF88 family protein